MSLKRHATSMALPIPQAIPHTVHRRVETETPIDMMLLPFDVLILVLTYLKPQEVEGSIVESCKFLRDACRSERLWHSFCLRTGKILAGDKLPTTLGRDGQTPLRSFRELYYCIPCVPTDFPTVGSALKRCPCQMSQNLITLMPGTYSQRFDLDTNNFRNNQVGAKTVVIRAAFPHLGAGLIHCDNYQNQSCVNIYTSHESGSEISVDPLTQMTICLVNLQILHSTSGVDIWGGNCALRVDGQNTTLSLDRCTLQSDSGRGIVVTTGAQLFMKETVVHDCAATGLYIGDFGSHAHIQRCNIIRNGGGSRPVVVRRCNRPGSGIGSSDDYVQEDSTDDDGGSGDDPYDMVLEDDDDGFGDTVVVPPGHSGMYVETGNAIVDDSLLAGNSLTGLSVVRGGTVKLSSCDITENGAEPVTIEDAHDMHMGIDERGLIAIRGGVRDMGGNNYENVALSSRTSRNNCVMTNRESEYPIRMSLGGFVRPTPFLQAIDYRMTEKRLKRAHSKLS